MWEDLIDGARQESHAVHGAGLSICFMARRRCSQTQRLRALPPCLKDIVFDHRSTTALAELLQREASYGPCTLVHSWVMYVSVHICVESFVPDSL